MADELGKWLTPMGRILEDEVLDDLQFGSLGVLQRKGDYCFTSDAVLLANFAQVHAKDRVVELCAGSGVISIIVASKRHPKEMVAVELDPTLADRCARTVDLDRLGEVVKVWQGDVKDAPQALGGGFDVVIANPPYYPVGIGEMPRDPSVAMGRFEVALTMRELVASAAKLLRYGGRLYLVHLASRLAELLDEMRGQGVEPKTVYVVSPSLDAPADVVLVEGKKGGKVGLEVRSFVREDLQKEYYRQDE